MTSEVIFLPCFSPSKMSSGPEKFAMFLDYVKSLTHSHYSDSINMHSYKRHCILCRIFAHKHLILFLFLPCVSFFCLLPLLWDVKG